MSIEVEQFLAQAGYHRVPLNRSGVGHFQAEGTLNDSPVIVLIDTGASSTVLNLALAEELELKLEELSFKGGGAGGSEIAVYKAPDAVLRLDGVSPRLEGIVAMDLTHVNQSLATRGEGPVHVILGVDVFDSHSAVIDYGSDSLFLRL